MDPQFKIEDLQAVSQHMLASAERIRILEQEKRTVAPGSPRFQELSNEIEAVAAETRVVSHAETALARDLVGVPGLPTVEEADETSRRAAE